ncbi:MAG: glycosyltransferase family 39 protein, partial [Actinomycetota bacterium]
MTDTVKTAPPDPVGSTKRSPWWSLAATLALVGGALFAFDWFSAGSEVARRGVFSQRPPVYGRFEPSFSRWGAIALALAAVIGAASFVFARRDRMRPLLLLPVAVAMLISFAAAVAFVNGEKIALVDPLYRTKLVDYQVDVKTVQTLGVRPFVERFPEIAHTLQSVHSRDHPPGPIVLLSVLRSLSPGRLVPRAIALAFLSSLMLVAAWMMAKRLGGDRAALLAVLLLVVAPGVVLFTFTSLDAVFGALLSGSAALLVWGFAADGRLRYAVLGGAALALSSFFTYGFLWIIVFAGIYALLTRGIRGCMKPLAAAGAGFVGGVLLLRVGLGYDLVAAYRASYELVPQLSKRSAVYWFFGDPAVWLTFAGLPIAALS